MQTFSAKPAEVEKKWVLIDAKGLVVGRLATLVAMRLRGKHLPTFTPHVDLGDFVVVVNADKIVLTGKKWQQKTYYRYSGYIGGMKNASARKMSQEKPEALIRLAVRGMLPKNRLGRSLLKKLKIYRGAEHPHEAQQPLKLAL